jgi:hypothetical protein
LKLSFKIAQDGALRKRVMIYSAAFLIPLVVRIIPELQSPVPIGFDTPYYLASAKQMAGTVGIYPLYTRVLSVMYELGVDLLVFMKVFPALVYAGTVLVACAYADARLGWDRWKTLTLAVVMTFSAPMLRTSWDLQRQSLATLLLLLAIYFDLYIDPKKRGTGLAVLVNCIIGLLHEITLAVATVIPLWSALREARHRRFPDAVRLLIISATPIILYELGTLTAGNLFIPTSAFENALDVFGPYPSLIYQQVGIFLTFFWALAPLAALGHFRNPNLDPWLVLTATTGFSRVLLPWFAMKTTDRWMLYMTIPLLFYVVEAISRSSATKGLLSLGGLGTGCAVLLLSAQGIGMLGFVPFQAAFPGGQYPNLMPKYMAYSTAEPEHIVAVLRLTDFVNSVGGNVAIATQSSMFGYWAKYESKVPVITFKDEQGIDKEIDQARRSGYSSLFIIWFKGHLPDTVVLSESDLALYRVDLS